MALTDARIRKLKPTEKNARYADGQGLSLLIKASGAKLWRFRYRHQGKQKDLALGAYPDVSLSQAREKTLEARKLVASGIDPSEARKSKALEDKSKQSGTFAVIADELLQKLVAEGKSQATIKKKRWLIDMAVSDFGAVHVSDLSAAIILKTLRKVEIKGAHETANRLRSTIGQVCRFAISTARLDNDPTSALRGALIAPKVRHISAITEKLAFKQLVRDAWRYDGAPSTKMALKLIAILYPRPGELRLSRWNEFDLSAGIWTIPPEHEKNRREHKKPLSALSIELLRAQAELTYNFELVFPSASNPKKSMSENAINQALHRMGYKNQHSSHGFRSSASSLLNESGRWNPDAIEAELGHLDRNQIRRTYHRANYWEERKLMTEWWSSQLDDMVN